MGQAASGGLTQFDVDDVINTTKGVFGQAEVEALYKRFRSLDRGRKGYINDDEFLGIPELSINPLAQRLVRTFECVNFKEFARLLSVFSPKSSRDEKLEFMFSVYDVDGDGILSRDDLMIMLRQLSGSSVSDTDLDKIIDRVMQETHDCLAAANPKGAPAPSAPHGIDLPTYKTALAGVDLSNMVVEVPIEY